MKQMGFAILILTLIGISITVIMGGLVYSIEKKYGVTQGRKYIYLGFLGALCVYIVTQFFIGDAAIFIALGSWAIIILITSKVIHKPRKNKSYSKDST